MRSRRLFSATDALRFAQKAPVLITRDTHIGLHVLLGALALGIAGDYLFRAAWGLNAALWLGSLAATGYVLARRWQTPLDRDHRWLLIPLGLLALCFVWRAAPMLLLANTLLFLGLLTWSIQRTQALHLRATEPFPAEPGFVRTWLRAFFGLPVYLVRDIEWKQVQSEERRRTLTAVLRGTLLALPVLFLFGALLVSADALFERLVVRLFEIDVASLPGHMLLTVVLAWSAGAFLRGVLTRLTSAPSESSPSIEAPTPPAPPARHLGLVEASILLGLVNALFAVFVVLQARYLFGGLGVVLGTDGLTLATYARRGFFELVTVATLAVPLLLIIHRFLDLRSPEARQRFRTLGGLQVGLLLLMLTSAAQRMWLYQASYGLTELRVYVSATLLWLAAVLVWLGWTVLRDRADCFVPGSLAAAFVVLLGLNVLSPDALIARVNLQRAQDGQPLDVTHLATLSSDAVPVLLEALPHMPPDQRDALAHSLHSAWHAESRSGWALDWRGWNRSRVQAHALLEDHWDVLARAAAP